MMRFGLIGRCGCGAIGARREHFSGEPICGACVRLRTGRQLTIHERERQERVIGRLTPAQRIARVRHLRDAGFEEQRLVKLQRELDAGYQEREDLDGDGRHM